MNTHVDANTLVLTILSIMTWLNNRRQKKATDKVAHTLASQDAKLQKAELVQKEIHTLSNGSRRTALAAVVVALKSDSVSKLRIALLTKKKADVEVAKVAEVAVADAQKMLDDHDANQAKVDAEVDAKK